MKITRLLAVLLVLVLAGGCVFILSACGGDDIAEAQADAEEAGLEFANMMEGAKEEVEARGD